MNNMRGRPAGSLIESIVVRAGPLLFFAVFVFAPCIASAQNYPNRPIRFIVPFPAGGATDIVARVAGQKLGEVVGQTVVIDNRPGAGTIVGTDAVCKAAPDGYTVLVGTTSLAVNVSLYGKLPYDAMKDLAPVTEIGSWPLTLVVHPSVPAKSVKELVALSKSKPGLLNYCSSGTGALNHLFGEMLKTMAGIDIVHVAYKGSAPCIADMMGGHVQMSFNAWLELAEHINAGKLRALAVTDSKRHPLAPNLPTIAESGFPKYEGVYWIGLLVPSKTPKDIVAKLNAEAVKALQMPETKERLAKQMGVEIKANRPEEFTEYIKTETAKFTDVIKTSGARAD